jgi:8-amino-7-oxononanoate synthase
VLALPTLTHIHFGVLPALAEQGTLLVDLRAHQTIHDGAVVAAHRGAAIRRFRHGDVAQVERLLRSGLHPPRVICLDGVNSMTGNPPDLPAFAALAREPDALRYVDDAHGFGVIGERDGYEPSPTAGSAMQSFASSASPTTRSSSPPASPRRIRRWWPSWPARPGSSST